MVKSPLRSATLASSVLSIATIAFGCTTASHPAPLAQSGDAGGVTALGLPFSPSNVNLDGIDLAAVGDYVVDQPSCTLDTTMNLASCGDGAGVLGFKLATQIDGSKVAVYVARSFKVPGLATLILQGANPIVIVALDTIEIGGKLVASAHGDVPGPGGKQSVVPNAPGEGAGAGAAGSQAAGSGAGYCGGGGQGAAEQGDPNTGGTGFGLPMIIPLVGGASGGSGDPGVGGGGGGGVQFVAGTSITVEPGASINVGGGGGGFGGATGVEQQASGGGSGGSILLESLVVNLGGTLAANGGGGGGGTSTDVPSGKDGTASTSAAAGGNSGVSPGGEGGAFIDIDGKGGSDTPGNTAGGGGGGVGRIRINTKSGAATIVGGVLSPGASSECVTQGTVS